MASVLTAVFVGSIPHSVHGARAAGPLTHVAAQGTGTIAADRAA